MPCVTEESWPRFDVGESIVLAPWPSAGEWPRDAVAGRECGFLQEVVTEIRRLQTGAPAGLGKAIELDRTWAEDAAPYLDELAAVTRAEIALVDLDGAKARLRISAEADAGPLVEAKRKKLREARAELGRK